MLKSLISKLAVVAVLLGCAVAFAQVNALHGLQEFKGAGIYSWTAPTGVSALYVELWGAGGGGSQRTSTASGNGGGSGAYVRNMVPVTPGQTYHIAVGTGGKGDTGAGSGNGGDTQVSDAFNTVLTYAGGGTGGVKGSPTPAPGGVPDPNAGIQRNGANGQVSITVSKNYKGGPAIAGSVAAPYFMDGGAGSNSRSLTGPGGDGGSGYAVLTW